MTGGVLSWWIWRYIAFQSGKRGNLLVFQRETRFKTNKPSDSLWQHSSHTEKYLLVRSLLRLSVLDLTTPQSLHLTIRKSSLLRLLRDLLSLLSLLLNISNRHADNSSLHLERLLATTLALLSSLPSSPLLFKPYLRLLVVTSPSSRPANASGSLLLLVQRAALLVQVTHGLVITLTRTTPTCPSLRMYIPPCPG